MEVKCNKDCFNCEYEDCVCSDPATLGERDLSDSFDKEIILDLRPKVLPELGMIHYIRNRPDKEAYQKARDAEYDRKRVYDPDKKRAYYQCVKEEKKKYQKQYYQEHKDEISAKNKIRYEMNRELILERNRSYRKRRKEKVYAENNSG